MLIPRERAMSNALGKVPSRYASGVKIKMAITEVSTEPSWQNCRQESTRRAGTLPLRTGKFKARIIAAARQFGEVMVEEVEEPNIRASFGDGLRPRRGTATSTFGASRREGHDASNFYARFSAPDVSTDDELADPGRIAAVQDQIFVGDSRLMAQVPDNSVALVVTSPPYFAGKAYETALGEGHIPADYLEYLAMLTDVFRECRRVLEPGGRLVVNVANLGRKPFRSLASDVTAIIQDDLQMLLRGEIVWLKQRGSSGSCAWGSFRSATNPVLRDTTERLIVASKGRFDRALSVKKRAKSHLPSRSTISVDEFMEATLDVWEIQPESATRVNHPAPFPVALVERCIHLYSFEGDVILDPFMGSGSTAVASLRTGRHYVGFDADESYVIQARERLVQEEAALSKSASTSEERSIRDVATEILEQAGYIEIDWQVRVVPGLEIAGRARRSSGETLLFDLAGGLTTGRAGLARGDLLWRAIGRAAVIANLVPREPFVVFTAGEPERPSGGAALEVVSGHGQPIAAVINVHNLDDAVQKLAGLLSDDLETNDPQR